MNGTLGLDREGLLDSVVNIVPLIIISLLTLLFVAHNPWGWREPLLIVIVFGLHLVPIISLVPVTYLLVKVLVEASQGRSDTADQVKSWFALTEDVESDSRAAEANPTRDDRADDRDDRNDRNDRADDDR